MAGIGNKIKLTVLKSMEAVGQGASSLASNAQQKLQELNLETQRREILSAFPLKAYDLWQKGETLPEPLEKMLKELSDLDERLGVLRAQRYVKVEGSQEGEAAPAQENNPEEEGQHEEASALEADSLDPSGDSAQEDEPMDAGETGDNA